MRIRGFGVAVYPGAAGLKAHATEPPAVLVKVRLDVVLPEPTVNAGNINGPEAGLADITGPGGPSTGQVTR